MLGYLTPTMLFFSQLTTVFLFCSCFFWVADGCALCLLVVAPMLVCVPALLRSGSLVGAHLVYSSVLDCCVRAHACSFAASTLCPPAPHLHVALQVLCLLVYVVSELIRSFGFAFCPVAVYSMILCSCRPL
jgi:hypothetical protein